MNPLQWIAKNNRIFWVITFAWYIPVSLAPELMRWHIDADIKQLILVVRLILIVLSAYAVYIANHKYNPRAVPKHAVPLTWLVVYSVGAAVVILLAYLLIKRVYPI